MITLNDFYDILNIFFIKTTFLVLILKISNPYKFSELEKVTLFNLFHSNMRKKLPLVTAFFAWADLVFFQLS